MGKEMSLAAANILRSTLAAISAEQPVLIAGPTASGKSAVALEIAQAQGGVIVNADASQVYDCWRVISARPSLEEEALAPHLLYGHIDARTAYSAGHWLREVQDILAGDQRPIIVGGTGLYFAALTRGLADIPATPVGVRAQADALPTDVLLAQLDARTRGRIDILNRARVQRAWEVLTATGKGLAAWQDTTGTATLPLDHCYPIAFDVDKGWLNARIAMRFDQMLDQGALAEVEAVRADYDPALPAHRAIGVPELMAYLNGACNLDDARAAAVIATRQFAKRQRTWIRSKMKDWHALRPA
tara:strand:+ start:3659 stop:4561 length:903 start_codon:yes stop_codon:yes gene_type:complete